MTDHHRTPASGVFVNVLDEDPGLGRQLDPARHADARSAAVAPLLTLRPGIQPLLFSEASTHGHLGLLVIDGLLARHISFGQIGSTEFIGPGDTIRPWSTPEETEPAVVRWQVLTSTRIALLDREFAVRVGKFPEITSALLDRAGNRINSQLLQSAVRQARRVEDRVLLAMWHFASRWGQVGPDGRIVRLPNLTAQVLANIVGARRQSVSTALSTLQRNGSLKRRPDRSWVIPREPPQLAQIEIGGRASDHSPAALDLTA